MTQPDTKKRQIAKREPWNPLLISYPESEKVNKITPFAETLYTRLLAKCDDRANFYGDVALILAHLYSIRWKRRQINKGKVAKLLSELLREKLVYLYTVRDETYLHIINCKKHLRSDINRDWRFPQHPILDGDVSVDVSNHVPTTVRQARDAPTNTNTNTDTYTYTTEEKNINLSFCLREIKKILTTMGLVNVGDCDRYALEIHNAGLTDKDVEAAAKIAIEKAGNGQTKGSEYLGGIVGQGGWTRELQTEALKYMRGILNNHTKTGEHVDFKL